MKKGRLLLLIILALAFWWFFYKSSSEKKILPKKFPQMSARQRQKLRTLEEKLQKQKIQKAQKLFELQFKRKPRGITELIEKGFISSED
ncbi:MAG: hypothetical protein J7L42_03575 [Elusimicrobia bacterium]|nr:hypothetical protein [Elusimicrobiota bacterium]